MILKCLCPLVENFTKQHTWYALPRLSFPFKQQTNVEVHLGIWLLDPHSQDSWEPAPSTPDPACWYPPRWAISVFRVAVSPPAAPCHPTRIRPLICSHLMSHPGSHPSFVSPDSSEEFEPSQMPEHLHGDCPHLFFLFNFLLCFVFGFFFSYIENKFLVKLYLPLSACFPWNGSTGQPGLLPTGDSINLCDTNK